jgi:Calmodulin-binding
MTVQAAAEAARMPVGMRVLGDGERQEMLDALSRSNQQIQAQLLGMPLVLETPSQVPRSTRLLRTQLLPADSMTSPLLCN